MEWLHWIGKQYYTMNSFTKEAEKYGVSRRVSPQQMKQMNWGDTVYCAMLDGKTGVIFSSFTVDRITGLNAETNKKITEKHPSKLVDTGGYAVNRGCGEYTTGPTYSIDADIEEIANEVIEIEAKSDNKSKPMVSGQFTKIEPIRLLDIPFRQGFRAINGVAIRYEVEQNGNKVKGQFYLELSAKEWYKHNRTATSGEVQEVKQYHKNPENRKKGQQKARMPVQITLF